MQQKRTLSIACIVIIWVSMNPVCAESIYSGTSLKILCGNEDSDVKLACRTYVHGVVETWMLKDTVSVEPLRFKRRNGPIFCETILKVSADEWLRIVRSDLNSRDAGFAAGAVMNALSKNLCK